MEKLINFNLPSTTLKNFRKLSGFFDRYIHFLQAKCLTT